MWFDVMVFAALASLCSNLSSCPNMGAGLTIVVSGNMLLTIFSPLAWNFQLSRYTRCLLGIIYLRPDELRRRLFIDPRCWDVNEAINIIFSNRFGYSFRAYYMYSFQAEVSSYSEPYWHSEFVFLTLTLWDNQVRLGYRPRLNDVHSHQWMQDFVNHIPSNFRAIKSS